MIINGKASGIIDINTDKTLKLNGTIKFVIQNGEIAKIGLVEYVLKFAAIFRNPVAMISPGIFADIVNMPEGKFDKIKEFFEQHVFVKWLVIILVCILAFVLCICWLLEDTTNIDILFLLG